MVEQRTRGGGERVAGGVLFCFVVLCFWGEKGARVSKNCNDKGFSPSEGRVRGEKTHTHTKTKKTPKNETSPAGGPPSSSSSLLLLFPLTLLMLPNISPTWAILCAIKASPSTIMLTTTHCPSGVLGVISPNPTVLNVTMEKYRHFPNVKSGWTNSLSFPMSWPIAESVSGLRLSSPRSRAKSSILLLWRYTGISTSTT